MEETSFGRMAFQGKEKRPRTQVRRLLNLSRRRPTFPHSYPCSIIGPARLNFRVRDGNGCDPRGMTTGKSLPEVFKTSGQIRNHRDETRSAMATTVLAGEYKFGPLPNNYCVLQDVADWSSCQPAMNFISVTPTPEGGRTMSCRINDGLSKFYD